MVCQIGNDEIKVQRFGVFICKYQIFILLLLVEVLLLLYDSAPCNYVFHCFSRVVFCSLLKQEFLREKRKRKKEYPKDHREGYCSLKMLLVLQLKTHNRIGS